MKVKAIQHYETSKTSRPMTELHLFLFLTFYVFSLGVRGSAVG